MNTNFNQSNFSFNQVTNQEHSVELSRTFVSNVFAWMFLALGITAVTAYLFGSSSLIYLLVSERGMSVLGWIVMFSPFAFVLLISYGYNRLSTPVLTALFIVYSIFMGMSLSFILLIYTASSIFLTFIVCSVMFGIMAVAGYTTKADLSKFGSIMFMGLIGIIVASLINLFMRSDIFNYIISFIGVIVFTGLTAWDVQKLKQIGATSASMGENARKMAIMGAMTIYLDFINLFLFLLRFLGNRR